MAFPIPNLSLNSLLGMPLSHRFGVFFFIAGVIPNPLDIRFQRVSGLSTRVETDPMNNGGKNIITKRLPKRLTYDNLVLERGFVVGSPLNLQLNDIMNEFKFFRSDVIVTLFNEDAVPISAWMFKEAFPVRWATADLNAQEDRILIDTLELSFTRMLTVRL
ncbi:MAG TPA: phage tail protein [Synechococcales bacterium UBA10510]|nr:phage tail protein [Synechococcales bacterium UBA10510]